MFAWSPLDITCVSPGLITHKLNIDPHVKPIQQKSRKFVSERNEAFQTEIEQLLAADIIFEIKYLTWLANPVMVRKSEGGWRMCVDFTDLNKACSKGCYPLPYINQKIEAVAGYGILNFLDLYRGYHQVFMDAKNAPKIAFITAFGIYAYKKMSFGLKDIGATYQRLVDKVFRKQIGWNVEIYLDDIVIKSAQMGNYIDDLVETLDTLRRT